MSAALAILAWPVAAQEFETREQPLAGNGKYWTINDLSWCIVDRVGLTPQQQVVVIRNISDAWHATWGRVVDLTIRGGSACPSDRSNIQVVVNVNPAGSVTNASQGSGGGQATMNLDVNENRFGIAHEWGHVLGFGHSQIRADADASCLDAPNSLPVSDATANSWVSDRITRYDALSIMNYCSGRQGVLSPLDVAGAQSVYGPARDSRRHGANEASDMFGFALATGDFDGDGNADVAIGNLSESIGDIGSAGAVFVRLGNDRGWLEPAQVLTQQGVGRVEAGDMFGHTLAVGNFDGKGDDELAVAVPGEKPGDIREQRGAINIYTWRNGRFEPWKTIVDDAAATGAVTTFPRGLQLGRRAMAAGDAGTPDGRDELFATLDPISGSTHRVLRFGQKPDGSFGFLDEVTAPVPASAIAVGDVNALSGAEVIVGYSAADQGRGEVRVWGIAPGRGRFSGVDTLQQDKGTANTPTAREERDWFGASLAVADFDGNGTDDVAIGSPGEDIGTVSNAGMVTIAYGARTGRVVQYQHIAQDALAGSSAETDDRFGHALAAGDFDGDGAADLAVSATNETLRGSSAASGALTLFRGGRSGLRFWHGVGQRPAGADEDGDTLGHALAAGDIDEDGRTDLLVTALRESVRGQTTRAGAVWVYRYPPVVTMEPWFAFDQEGG